MEQYGKECCKNELNQILKVYVFSLRRASRTFCSNKRKSKKKLEQLLQAAPCINTQIKQFQCIDQLKDDTKKMIPLKDDKLKIKYSCW